MSFRRGKNISGTRSSLIGTGLAGLVSLGGAALSENHYNSVSQIPDNTLSIASNSQKNIYPISSYHGLKMDVISGEYEVTPENPFIVTYPTSFSYDQGDLFVANITLGARSLENLLHNQDPNPDIIAVLDTRNTSPTYGDIMRLRRNDILEIIKQQTNAPVYVFMTNEADRLYANDKIAEIVDGIISPTYERHVVDNMRELTLLKLLERTGKSEAPELTYDPKSKKFEKK